MPKSLTRSLCEKICAADPCGAPEAIAAAREALIDWLACALAGARDTSTAILITNLAKGARGPAQLIGFPQQVDVFSAALINAYAGHVLDYDDVHASIRGHPTTVILPALLAAAHLDCDIGANALLAAYVVGVETMARLGLAIGMRHYEKGFHATATLGPFGAAAAIAHLKGFSPETTAVALGLAATQAAGLRLQFGYDGKPLHAGFAARAGLTAALLAQAGLTGAPAALDGEMSFLRLFGFEAEQPEHAVDGFGDPWQLLVPGLTFKAFPCCTASHPVAVAGLRLRADHAPAVKDIRAATITFPPGGDAALVVTRPQTGIDARFSAEYVLAVALLHGKLSLAQFDAKPVDPVLAEFAARVQRRHDAKAPPLSADSASRFVEVELLCADGQTYGQRVQGLPKLEDPATKFAEVIGATSLAEVPALVRRMSNRNDLEQLFALLASPPRTDRGPTA